MPQWLYIVLKSNRQRTQRITISLIHSPCMLFTRRSGRILRHSLTVAPLPSLNGKLGLSLFCRLPATWHLLHVIIHHRFYYELFYIPLFIILNHELTQVKWGTISRPSQIAHSYRAGRSYYSAKLYLSTLALWFREELS